MALHWMGKSTAACMEDSHESMCAREDLSTQ